jgi:pantothenate kinase type III
VASDKSVKRTRCDVFTLNVGNTNTKIVGWRSGGPAKWLAWKTEAQPPRELAGMLQTNPDANAPVVLAGVVPAYKEELAARLFKLGREALIFRKDLKPEIEIVPRPVERVGDDRIAGAMGALALNPSWPWVIVDVGTAMTINAVTPGRAGRLPRFEGGLIVPSTITSLMALSEYTAQLPRLERLPVYGGPNCPFIGRSTEQAMLLGVYHAQFATALALAKGQMRELGPRARVVLTGGGATDSAFAVEFKAAFQAGKVVSAPELVHFGLLSVWNASHSKPSIGGV